MCIKVLSKDYQDLIVGPRSYYLIEIYAPEHLLVIEDVF
jgi:hypothetical protein